MLSTKTTSTKHMHEYDSLPSGDVSDLHVESPPYPHSRNHRRSFFQMDLSTILQLLILIIVATLASLCIFQFAKRTAHINAGSVQSCGNTSSDARSRNCVFDLLSYSWMPRECYDSETAIEFDEWVQDPTRQSGKFPFFTSRNPEDRIGSMDTLAERVGIKTFTTQEEHVGHCVFLMRRLERARYGAFRYETVGGYKHVEHCSEQILERLKGENPEDVGRLNSIFVVGFVSC